MRPIAILIALAAIVCANAQKVDKIVHTSCKDGGCAVTIEGKSLPKPTIAVMKGNLLAVDFSATLNGKSKTQRLNDPHLASYRYGWYTNKPPKVRLVLTLKGQTPYRLTAVDNGYQIVLGKNAKPALPQRAEPIKSSNLAEPLREAVIAAQTPVEPPAAILASQPMTVASRTSRFDYRTTASDVRISLEFVRAEITDVLKALAYQSGVNIVTSPEVQGQITVSLTNVTVDEALNLVARLSKFHYRRLDSAYIVGSESSIAEFSRSPIPTNVEMLTDVIPLVNTSPGEVANYITAKFPSVKSSVPEKSAMPYIVLSGPKDSVVAAREAVLEFQRTVSDDSQIVAHSYRVKYSDARDLKKIVEQMVPTVSIALGPMPLVSHATLGGGSAMTSSAGSSEGGSDSAGASGSSQSASAGAPSGGTSASAAAAAPGMESPSTLLLYGPTGDVERALNVLAQADVRVPQVLIEARVVDLIDRKLSEIGIDWDFKQFNPSNSNYAPWTNELNVAGNHEGIRFGLIKIPWQVNATLNAMMTDQRNRLLASPKVAVLDGRQATIFIGDEINYVKSIQQTSTGINIETGKVNAGIILQAAPRVHEDSLITLNLHPEASVITGFLQVPGGGSLPQVARRFANTTIRIRDGETIVIGGLIREDEIRKMEKVPILGDLPIIGQLFRKDSKERGQSEIVIMITVRLISDERE